MGPGVVIGHQGQNAWVSFAGRRCLVAPEHLRGLAPDENATTRPLIREGLALMRAATENNVKETDTDEEAEERYKAGRLRPTRLRRRRTRAKRN